MVSTVKHLPYHIDENTNLGHFYENHWKKVGLELLLRHLEPANNTVLDYGCGRGEAMELARLAGFVPFGTDADDECVRIASKNGSTALLNVNDPLSQFGEKSFDVVVCFHVLEHVDNPKSVLTALAKIARKYVVTAVPNLRRVESAFHHSFHGKPVNEGHLQSWDHGHFRNLAERHCGLKLVEWGHDATVLPYVDRILRMTLGLRAEIWFETGLFRKIFPYSGISVLGLWEPVPLKY